MALGPSAALLFSGKALLHFTDWSLCVCVCVCFCFLGMRNFLCVLVAMFSFFFFSISFMRNLLTFHAVPLAIVWRRSPFQPGRDSNA